MDFIDSREDMQGQIAKLRAEVEQLQQQLQLANDKLWEVKKDAQVCHGPFTKAMHTSVFSVAVQYMSFRNYGV